MTLTRLPDGPARLSDDLVGQADGVVDRTGAPGHRSAWVSSAAILVIAAILVLILRQWVLTPYRVGSDSMEPAITPGSTVLVTPVALPWSEVTAQDIVAFEGPRGPMLKRVVGVAGDDVSIIDAVLHVNGYPVDEPYVDLRSLDGVFFGPVTVPDDHIFVMGDNRFPSVDSRHFGPVPLEDVTGRMLHTFGPFGGS